VVGRRDFLVLSGVVGVVMLLLSNVPGLLQSIAPEQVSHVFSWKGIDFRAACGHSDPTQPSSIFNGGRLEAIRSNNLMVSDEHVFMSVGVAPVRGSPGGAGCLVQSESLNLRDYKEFRIVSLGKASSAHKRAGSTVRLFLTSENSGDVQVGKAFTDRTHWGTSEWGDVVMTNGAGSCPQYDSPGTIRASSDCMNVSFSLSGASFDPVNNLWGPYAVSYDCPDNAGVLCGLGINAQGKDEGLNLLFEIGAGNSDDKGGSAEASLEILGLSAVSKDGSVVSFVSNRTRPSLDGLVGKGIGDGRVPLSSLDYSGAVRYVSEHDWAEFVPDLVTLSGGIADSGSGSVGFSLPKDGGMFRPGIYLLVQEGSLDYGGGACGPSLGLSAGENFIYDISGGKVLKDGGKFFAKANLLLAEGKLGSLIIPSAGGVVPVGIILVVMPGNQVMWSFDGGETYTPLRTLNSDKVRWTAETNYGSMCPIRFKLLGVFGMSLEQYLTIDLSVGSPVLVESLGVLPVANLSEEVLPIEEPELLLNATRESIRPLLKGGGLGLPGKVVLVVGGIILLFLLFFRGKK